MFLILDEVCDDVALATTLTTIENVFQIICIAVPIILIISVIITLGKMVIDPSLKDAAKGVIKKIIAALVVFFLPTLVNFGISMLSYANIKNDTFSSVLACFSAARESSDYIFSHPYTYDTNSNYSFSNVMSRFEAVERYVRPVINTSSGSATVGGGNGNASSDGAGGMGIPRYYQGDYAHVVLKGDRTIATSGCGFTSGAMVASYLTGEVITPETLADLARQYYVYGSGMSWAFPEALASTYNLGSVTTTTSIDEVVSALGEGRPVMSSQAAGLFTSGGHLIVLSGLDENGNIWVNDPNKNNAVNKGYNDRAFTPSEINASNRQYWIFEAKK